MTIPAAPNGTRAPPSRVPEFVRTSRCDRPTTRWPRRTGPILVLALLALSLVPVTALPAPGPAALAHCPGVGSCAVSIRPAVLPPPLHGLVTKCASSVTCSFVFNTTNGTGWANASPPSINFQLPGEALVSHNVSYSTYTAKLTGTYTYWTVGNFVGTDANSRKVVYGTTNTNFTITCIGHSGRGGGCTYKYTTDNGTIVVNFTNADQTTTSVACTPATIAPSSSTVCTARVNDTADPSAVPTGNVSFSGSFGGTTGFSTGGLCTLVGGTCSVSYTTGDEQLGTVPISATFAGGPAFYTSSGRTSIYISASGGGGSTSYSSVFFFESGLPNGTVWSVTFDGLLLSSTNATVAFEVQNGTYAFSVTRVGGYLLSPVAGNVTVAGSDVGVPVTFSLATYPVTFTATGLPLGRSWSVAVDGSIVNGTQSTVTFNLSNGTHSYLVRGPAGYRVVGIAAAGAFTVNGSSVNLSATLVRGGTLSAAFVERGLPRGTVWCVWFGWVGCSPTSVVRFTNLTPGIYAYSVEPMVGQVITARVGLTAVPATGNLSVTNHSVRVLLRFTYPYSVTFSESGLLSGTNWSVTIGGITENSTNSTITFELGNGTHYYRVGAIAGYLHSGLPAAARVLGAAAYVAITFRPG